ncbi:MAG: penicillin-binding protein 2 [Elusimicrobiota bacterium]
MQTLARLRLCLLLCAFPLLPISIRLVHLQILQHKDMSSRVRSSTARHLIEIIPRGRILDREGRVLAQSLPAWSCFIDLKAFSESTEKAGPRIARLAQALGMDAGRIAAKMKSTRRTVWLKRKLSYDESARLKALKMRSLGIVADEKRFYPNEDLARSLLGAVSADGRGSAGLEFAFDRKLSGRAMRWQLTRDGSGRAILDEPEQQQVRPPDLRLTIDRNLQFIAEAALAETVQQYKAKSGSVLIQDPRNGEILAMAVYPSDPYHNSAVQDIYEPGSTYKVVTAAAAVESGEVQKDERIDCENGKWQLTEEIRIKDHEKLGRLTLREIIQYSSNIGSAKIGLRLGSVRMDRYSRLFGFGYKTGIPLPAENKGLMMPAKRANQVRLANVSFGQGVAVTPLQLVTAYSAIANGGTLLEPQIIHSGEAARGNVVVRRVVKTETARALQAMLEGVVESGTGVSAQIPGYRIAGKTGTAQKVDPKTKLYSETDYVSSFAGYVPAEDPRYTLLVVIDSPQKEHYGSIVAAPLFKKIVRSILALHGIEPVRPLPLRLSVGEKKPRPAPRPHKKLPPPSLLDRADGGAPA